MNPSAARPGQRVLIVSGQHFAGQPRKVDLHFMAESLKAMGHPVDFLSVRLSHVSRFIRDGRWDYARTRPLNAWAPVDAMGDEFIWMNVIHPLNLRQRTANALSDLVFRSYGERLPQAVAARMAEYRLILVESGISVLLIHRLRQLAPGAAIVYHAADRLGTIGTHPAAARHLAAHASDIDLAQIMAEAIRADIPPGIEVLYLPHGLSKTVFDNAVTSPYKSGKQAVSVGDMLFDGEAIMAMARSHPDWTIHLFGRLARLDNPPANVIAHGEMPFEELAAYIRHADIGIAPYAASHDADYLSQSSMKMIQYTYCRLPIVAPDFAAAGRPHVAAYSPGDADSIARAFATAAAYPRETIDISSVMTWDEKTARLIAAADQAAGRAGRRRSAA